MKVRHNLRFLMYKHHINSIRELSERTGIHYRTLQNFSSYVHKKLDPDLIAKLCEFFKCDVSDLIYLEKEVV